MHSWGTSEWQLPVLNIPTFHVKHSKWKAGDVPEMGLQGSCHHQSPTLRVPYLCCPPRGKWDPWKWCIRDKKRGCSTGLGGPWGPPLLHQQSIYDVSVIWLDNVSLATHGILLQANVYGRMDLHKFKGGKNGQVCKWRYHVLYQPAVARWGATWGSILADREEGGLSHQHLSKAMPLLCERGVCPRYHSSWLLPTSFHGWCALQWLEEWCGRWWQRCWRCWWWSRVLRVSPRVVGVPILGLYDSSLSGPRKAMLW